MAGVAFAALCLVAFSVATGFVDEPNNLTVEVGSQAIFRCSFSRDYDCSTLHWVYSSSQCTLGYFSTLAFCSTVFSVPYIDSSQISSAYGKNTILLQISDVQPSHAGYYACQNSHLGEFSRCGRLTVVDPPTPQCTMLSSSVRVGDTLRLMCRVPEEAQTQTNLTWHAPGTSSSTRSLKVDPGQSYTIERVLHESDKLGMSTCIAGNDINTGPNCTLYPFEIKAVSVSFQQQKSGENSALMFVCFADAVLPDTRYSWSVSVAGFNNGTQLKWIEADTDGRFVLVGDQTRVLLLIPGEGYDDGMGFQVGCTAYSVIGTSKTSAAVTVLGCPDGYFVTNNTDCADFYQDDSSYTWMAVFALLLVVPPVIGIIMFFIKKRLKRKTTDSREEPTLITTTPQQAGLLRLLDASSPNHGPISCQAVSSPTLPNITTPISNDQSSFAPELPPPKPLPFNQRRFQLRGMTAPQQTGLLRLLDASSNHGPISCQAVSSPTLPNITTPISNDQSSFAPELPPPKPLPFNQRRFQLRGMTAPPLKPRGENALPAPLTDSAGDGPVEYMKPCQWSHSMAPKPKPKPRIPQSKSTQPTVKANPNTPGSSFTIPE